MFGRVYAGHLDILTKSFGQINKQYQKKIKTNQDNPIFIEKLKKLYILIFGIPVIGFQIRSIYFKKILNTHLFNKNLKKMLDAGSGIGAYTFLLGKTFSEAKVTGVDIDRQKLRSCQTLTKELKIKNLRFIYSDITKIHGKNAYDLVITIDVLEHIIHYELVLKNLYRLLRSNGYLYIHVPQPNQKRIFSSFKNWHHERSCT